ncbi:MAG: putative tail tube protein [Prokaryotic dsDNA virus sp.]|nr:MAG: putative tail tube protein [Prokaryotic dsDNA virus sp.]|tara:strand:- start:17403 stop:17810 length:408 start_codon:yes stop_codon:yes gene_type:complete
MATTGVFNGTDLVLEIEGNVIGHTTSCSLSLSLDTPEATTKDSGGFSEFIGGIRGGEISFEGLVAYDDTLNAVELADYLLNRTKITAVFGTSESGDVIYTAESFLSSVEVSAEMEAAVSYSGSLTITGAIVKSTN